MARLPTKIECSTPEVELGTPLRCRLLVYNAADQVDEVTARATGPLADWVRIDPERLALMPETEGALDVTFEAPTDAAVEAGEHPLAVEVRSGLAGTMPSIEEVMVDVGRVTGASLAVRRAAGEPDGTYEVEVRSRANHPLHLALAVDAPVGVALDPPVLDLEPFGRATARLRVEDDRGDTDRPVTIAVTARDDRLELRAETTHRPSPPAPKPCMSKRWLAAGLVVAALLLIGAESRGLVLFLLVLLGLWVLFGYAGCRIMAGKGRDRRAGWALGMVLGPFGLVIAALLPPGAEAETRS